MILFFILLVIIGVARDFYTDGEKSGTQFDYSAADSIFNDIEDLHSATILVQKNVASEPELLDFSEHKIYDTKLRSDSTLLVNINVAGIEELKLLPGIGEKTAEKIIKYRTVNGHFSTISEILNVKGIGAKKFERIKKFIIIE